jgi:hypothetical protein
MNEHDANAIAQLTLDLADVRQSLELHAAVLKGIQDRLARVLSRHLVPEKKG